MYKSGLHILEKLHYLSDLLKYLSDFKWFSNQRNWKKKPHSNILKSGIHIDGLLYAYWHWEVWWQGKSYDV